MKYNNGSGNSRYIKAATFVEKYTHNNNIKAIWNVSIVQEITG